MSFLLIKSHLVQILQCIDIQCFVRKGQRKMKVLDRNFSSSRSYPVDAVTVVGKRISSFWVHGEKRKDAGVSIVVFLQACSNYAKGF